MKRALVLFLLSPLGFASAQTSADSVTLTFRVKGNSGTLHYVPGQFNNWGPNSNGVINPGAPSQMSYHGGYGAWVKTYTFRIHDPGDPNRTLGDSVYQYKFNAGGCNTCWFSDPLNLEQNALDNNNSVLRLSPLFWFQFAGTPDTGMTYSTIAAGLVHTNADSITSIRFETAPTELDSLTVVDVTSSFDRSLRILQFSLGTPVPKANFMRLVAKTAAGDSVVFRKISFTVKNLPMPADAKHGVTLPRTASGDSTTFRLFVPGSNLVMIRIAPQGQSPANVDPIVMHKNITSNDWWRNVKLDPNTTYEFVYELEGGKRIHDPWGRWTGTNGTRFSTGAAGLTADDYVWGSSAYQRPPLNRLVIYEMNVSEVGGGYFGKAGGQATFKDLIQILPHFNALGVNALELMPVNDFGIIGQSGFSWGYDVSHHFALEPQYGTPRDFKELVDSAHARGIAVILDVVFNHLNDPGPLWQMLPNEANNPYFKSTSDLRPNEDNLFFFKDMDHFTPETQEYIYQVLKMWIDEYRIDGFRYDFTQGIGWDTSQADKGILGWANRIAQEYGGTVYQIAEHLPESPALVFYSGLTGGWHDSFRDELFIEAQSQNRTLASLKDLVIGLGAYQGNDSPATPSRYQSRTEPVNGTVNHDEQSVIYELITFRNNSEALALIRDKLVGGLMFTSLGIPMLWQGMEFAEPRGWLDGGQRLSYRPVQFSRLQTQQGMDHFKYYRTLIHHRLFNPALSQGEYRDLATYGGATRTLVWGFVDSVTSTNAVVIANLSDFPQTLSNVPWLGSGMWYEALTKGQIVANDSVVTSVSIPAYALRIYTNRTDSALGIPVSVDGGIDRTLPKQFALEQNYPNPFNPMTTLTYSMPEAGNVFLAVYDLLGREVRILVDGRMNAGVHRVQWDGRSQTGQTMSSGIYFARIRTGQNQQVRKLVLVR